MRINHNIAALNTYRQLSANQSLSSKSLEKLSSGLRINRAGDDAAGLAISEKMRGQIRGLQQASRNAQDGISMIQTAEGSLNEVHSILQRMRELAVQAANDTNTTDDRDEIQKEINQLTSEINRIANTTEFNTQNLLDGSLGSTMDAPGVTVKATQVADDTKPQINTITLTDEALVEGVQITIGDKVVAFWDSSAGTYADEAAAKAALGAAYVVDIADAETDTVDEVVEDIADNVTPTRVTLESENGTITVTATENNDPVSAAVSISRIGSGRTLQIGANASQSFTIYFENMDAEALNMASETGGATYTTSDGKLAFYTSIGNVNDDGVNDQFALDVSTAEKASAAISAIDDAMSVVSAQRSKLGGYQNRLEHTIANLGTAAENLTAAESRIRDVDMANEMMEFTKMNILQQAATAMLAQANQQPQNILQLLR